MVMVDIKATNGAKGKAYRSKRKEASVSKARAVTRAGGRPGYTRIAGYYGRFAGRGAEKKFFDTTLGGTASTTAGAIVNASLNIVPEGNGESDRIGRKITIHNIRMRGQLNLFASPASTSGTIVRVMVYQDMQTNGAAATVGDLLESANWRAYRNLANQSRFVVLLDKVMAISPQAATITSADVIATQNVARVFHFNKKCAIPIEFDNSATTGVITSQRSNNIGVLYIAEAATVTLDYICRIRYTDV